MSDQPGLRILTHKKLTWRLPDDNVVDEVIVPALRKAEHFDCMVGFFGGEALRELAPGLAAFISRTNAPVRLLISPTISETDRDAIATGAEEARETLERVLGDILNDEQALTSALAQHTLRCLSYLLAVGRIEVKVVLVRDGLFHLKDWIFSNGHDIAWLSGSANFTGRALKRNHEKLNLHLSWGSESQKAACEDTIREFNEYWANEKNDTVSIELPVAIAEDLLNRYGSDEPPTEEQFEKARSIDSKFGNDQDEDQVLGGKRRQFAVPSSLVWETGTYRHQGDAVHAWEHAGRRGVLVMATGAGKTITSLVAAHRLYEEIGRLLVVIAAPSRPLVEQWASEARIFGLDPYSVGSDSRDKRLRVVEELLHNLELEISNVECLIVTLDFMSDHEFLDQLERYRGQILLIADEVHNFGTDAFMDVAPECVEFRLGLSATPDRYEETETLRLKEYFGETVFEFGLDKAIGVCLVPYDYHLQVVDLDQEEMREYRSLTQQIRDCLRKPFDSEKQKEETLQKLQNRRRLVLEDAHDKIAILEALVDAIGSRNLKYALFYATDKNPKQLEEVNRMLAEKGISFHQITNEETSNSRLVQSTIGLFRRGELQALTAKRVLDEGLNVPEISTAFILASTTVKRQWVQRRGRVLRTCPIIGKEKAVIYDFLVLPPSDEPDDGLTKQLVLAELKRCEEFAYLAQNRAAADGPLEVIGRVRLNYIIGEQQ